MEVGAHCVPSWTAVSSPTCHYEIGQTEADGDLCPISRTGWVSRRSLTIENSQTFHAKRISVFYTTM